MSRTVPSDDARSFAGLCLGDGRGPDHGEREPWPVRGERYDRYRGNDARQAERREPSAGA